MLEETTRSAHNANFHIKMASKQNTEWNALSLFDGIAVRGVTGEGGWELLSSSYEPHCPKHFNCSRIETLNSTSIAILVFDVTF